MDTPSKKFFEFVWLFRTFSQGIYYEDNLEYTFEKNFLKLFNYFQKFS